MFSERKKKKVNTINVQVLLSELLKLLHNYEGFQAGQCYPGTARLLCSGDAHCNGYAHICHFCSKNKRDLFRSLKALHVCDEGFQRSSQAQNAASVRMQQMKCRKTKYSLVLRQPNSRAWAQHCVNSAVQFLTHTMQWCWICQLESPEAVSLVLCLRWDMCSGQAVLLVCPRQRLVADQLLLSQGCFQLELPTAKNENAPDIFTQINLFSVTFFLHPKGYFDILLICCICFLLLIMSALLSTARAHCFASLKYLL